MQSENGGNARDKAGWDVASQFESSERMRIRVTVYHQ
jgi:hypothetical protein